MNTNLFITLSLMCKQFKINDDIRGYIAKIIKNEAVNKISINYNYSFLVIAKSSMLNNEYKIIKETLFQDFKKIK